MRARTVVFGAAAVVGGSFVAQHVWESMGDCRQSFAEKGFGVAAVGACVGSMLPEGDEGHAAGEVDHPEAVSQKRISSNIRLMLPDIEIEMVFPKGSDGKLSKVDWKEGWGDFVVDGTRFVQDTTFVVHANPVATLGEDYTRVDVGVEATVDDEKKKSTFTLEPLTEDSVSPTKVTKIIAHADALSLGAVRVPTYDSDGNPNRIPFTQSNRVNNGVAATFDHVITDLALKRAASDEKCFENLLDIEAVEEHMEAYVGGAIDVQKPEWSDVPVDVEIASSDISRELAVDEYNDAVDDYRNMRKSKFADTSGDYKDIKIQFPEEPIRASSCDRVE